MYVLKPMSQAELTNRFHPDRRQAVYLSITIKHCKLTRTEQTGAGKDTFEPASQEGNPGRVHPDSGNKTMFPEEFRESGNYILTWKAK